VTDPWLRNACAARGLKASSGQRLFGSGVDLNQVLPLFLITVRAEVITFMWCIT